MTTATASTNALEDSAGDRLFRLRAAAYYDPATFFRVWLRTPFLYTWQRRACARIALRLNSGEKRLRVVIRTCHGAGKTFFSAGLVLWFLYTRQEPRILTLAQSWAGVEELLWGNIAKLYNGSLPGDLKWGRLLNTKLELSKHAFATGASSDKPENLEGQHSDFAAMRVIDEAKALDPEIFEATKGLLNAPENFDLWISTPSIQDGEFYRRDTDADPETIRIKVTVDDLLEDFRRYGYPTLAGMEAWKAECIKEWGGEKSDRYRMRCLAEYADNAEGALFPASWVERAFAADFTPAKVGDRFAGRVMVGMDVAGSVDGDQNAVAAAQRVDVVQGIGVPDLPVLQILGLSAWTEIDTMVSKARAVAFARSYQSGLRVDSIGLGKGVLDSARMDGYPTEEYRASDNARDKDGFQNRKAEEAWYFRELLEKRLVSLARVPEQYRQLLKKQMVGMRYEINPRSGKLQVVDPTDSPDLADAVLIASAASRPSIAPVQRLRGI